MNGAEVFKKDVHELGEAISKKRLVLFCGAGISMDFPTCLPSFREYNNTIIDAMEKLLSSQEQDTLKKEIESLKTEDENFPPELLMEKAYRYFGPKIIGLTDLFGDSSLKPNANHEMISALTKHGVRIILTTNFDQLIEKALGNEKKIFEGKKRFRELTALIQSDQLPEKPVVVKLHGSAGNHEEIILTLNQAGKPNTDTNNLVKALFECERYVFLFLGYRGGDFDLFPTILRGAEISKSSLLYWTFHPKFRKKEAEIEAKLHNAYNDRFHPIEAVASCLLQELNPENKRQMHQRKVKCSDEIKKKWIERLNQYTQRYILEAQTHRIFFIFADLAAHLDWWETDKRFLQVAWQYSKNANDNWGMAHAAMGFNSLLKNLFAGTQSKAHEIIGDSLIKYARHFAHSTKDPFIKGLVALGEGINAFKRTGNRGQAFIAFENAIGYFLEIKEEDHGLRDQYLGWTYTNIGHCYLNTLIDYQAQRFDTAALDNAIKNLEKAEEIFKSIGALDDLAEVYGLLGKCYNLHSHHFHKDFEKAKHYFDYALNIWEAINDRQGQAQAHQGLSAMYSNLRDVDKRKEHLEKSSKLFKEIKSKLGIRACELLSKNFTDADVSNFPRDKNIFVTVDEQGRRAYESLIAKGNIPLGDIVVSPDVNRTAFMFARRNWFRMECFVVVEGKPQRPYENIAKASLTFSPDSKKVAYAAFKGYKWFYVIDGIEQKKYDGLATGYPIFSPDSKRTAYGAKERNEYFVVIDGKEGKRYNGIVEGSITFSPDSKRVAYSAAKNHKQFIIVDDNIIGKEYDLADRPIFSLDSKSVACIVQENRKLFVIKDNEEQERYEDIFLNSLVFSSNSERITYVAKQNNKWFAVIDGKRQNGYDSIVDGSLIFEPYGQWVTYAATEGNDKFTVIDGIEIR